MQKFKIGDVVKFVGKNPLWRKEDTHVITEVVFLQGRFEYSTDWGAWFDEEDFVLVRAADKRSLAFLTKIQEEGQ